MSERQRFVRAAVTCEPEHVAAALRRIATVLDAGDDQRDVTFYSAMTHTTDMRECMAAWSQAALIIADESDMPTVKLRGIAAAIDRGIQGELPT
jgi:hypothetical protein